MTREGYITKIIYHNDENEYSVFEVETTEGDDIFVGSVPGIAEGMYIQADGEYVNHPQYDLQFRCDESKLTPPETIIGIKRFLSSGIIKGIKQALATRIVQKFGKDTLTIMEKEPERLAEIKGISEKMARSIAVSYRENYEFRNAVIFLSQYGINTNLAIKIFNEFGNDIYKIIKENPYRIADEIYGVGFKTADAIAMKAGIKVDSSFRLKSAILYVLNNAMADGNMYLPERELINGCYRLMYKNDSDFYDESIYEQSDIPEDFCFRFNDLVQEMIMNHSLYVKNQTGGPAYYTYWNFYTETSNARMLMDLKDIPESDIEDITKTIKEIEEETGIKLEQQQFNAVVNALTSGVAVITGGPGTGKTTIISFIIRYFEAIDKVTLLAAPTGRAAKRITESTGYQARTIHRMLEFMGAPEDAENEDKKKAAFKFMRNEENPLECDAVIVDEASMIDNYLMFSLLKAIPLGVRLILVGDTDQLPSVGAGNVLHDIINSGCFKVTVLNKIFRQADDSAIIHNAHKIKKGEHLEITNKSKDFFYIPRVNSVQIINELKELLTKNLPGYLGVSSEEIQVLTPKRRDALGVTELNRKLQESMNPPSYTKKEKEHRDLIFREGDKVMQIKNNYKLEWRIEAGAKDHTVLEEGIGVFNGDMGIIRCINGFDEVVTVDFDDGRTADYTYKDLDELEHSFAITIHKSQGSEYPAVIIPLLPGTRKLFNRNLLYTAVTRAKRMVVIVGDLDMVNIMIDNNQELRRYTGLTERIKEIQRIDMENI